MGDEAGIEPKCFLIESIKKEIRGSIRSAHTRVVQSLRLVDEDIKRFQITIRRFFSKKIDFDPFPTRGFGGRAKKRAATIAVAATPFNFIPLFT